MCALASVLLYALLQCEYCCKLDGIAYSILTAISPIRLCALLSQV